MLFWKKYPFFGWSLWENSSLWLALVLERKRTLIGFALIMPAFSNKYPLQRDIFCCFEALLLSVWALCGLSFSSNVVVGLG
jgi:hypothetical protein